MKNKFNKHKTHILYSLNINSRKLFVICYLSIFLIIMNFTYKYVESSFRPVVTSLAISETNTLAVQKINETIQEYLKSGIKYSDLTEISKNDEGEIVSIEANIQNLNKIKTGITEIIIRKNNEYIFEDVSIPMGNLTKSHFLTGRGPKIPVRVLITGSPSVDFDDLFESAGINQTRHKISIRVKAQFDIILPYETVVTEVTTSMLLCETIIVGEIPNVYIDK